MINQWLRVCCVIVICLMFASTLHAEEEKNLTLGKNSIIFLGFIKHVVGDPRNKEGYMETFAYAKELCVGKFVFETGFGTYVDSYDVRSYALFSNIFHEDFRYKIVTPILEVGVTNKGKDYDSDERQTYPLLIPKIRFGAEDGFFVDISGLPKIGDITNGWVGLDVGFKW